MTPLSANHHFVAIGASAGGLEAIHEFFDHMPVSPNLSFIIIQHLSPEHKSLLVELLAKHTTMSIVEAGHNMQPEMGCIYVIPNNKLLTIQNGILKLEDRVQQKAPNTAINTFFSSLAQDKRDKAIGVILSGTGTDGSQGAAEIKKNGGFVFVQDPLTAKFDGMPNSAITAGVADYILSPELIPEEIFNAINEQPKLKKGKDGLDESRLPQVLERIHEHCGYDFTNYKTPTLLRRISRRMDQLGKTDFNDYFDFLHESDEECELLGKDFLINVTKFFRDRPMFDILENEVFPKLISNRETDEPLKIWVTACSTGQEAYSVAILIDQYLQHTKKTLDVKIFACDIDKDAVEIAAKGLYPKSAIEELDMETRNRYFTNEGDQVCIIPTIRKQIVFTTHNILRDPPFIKNDLVTCRNMLIYMNPILQEKVFGTLQFALKTKGYLVLGPSEVPHSIKSSLEEIDGKWKVYKKVTNAGGYDPERFANYQLKTNVGTKNAVPLKESTIIRSLTDDFKDMLADELGYAAVYLDRSYEIKAAIGSYRKYLSLPDSIVNFNILKMVKTDLSVVLNTAIRKANSTGKRVTMKNVRAQINGTDRYINLIIKPSTANTYTTLVINEGDKAERRKLASRGVAPTDEESYQHNLILEDELRETRLNLQTAIEGLETANEELQSSNEELLSANEELQSSNEELQSLNEELHTLNTEHQLRIKELIELNDDLNNHFSSTHIGQVFLDGDLKIRKFSPAAGKVIHLRDSDIGRPIDHIATNILHEGFSMEELKSVLQRSAPVEKEVSTKEGRSYLMRILPYIRKSREQDGLVITFVDITANKELNNTIKGVFDSSTSVLMTVKSVRGEGGKVVDFECTAANHAASRFLHMGTAEYIGKRIRDVAPQLHQNGFFERCVAALQSDEPIYFETTFNADGKQSWFEVVLIKLMDGLVINLTNVNEKKEAAENLKSAYFEMVKAKDAVKKLNTDLEHKVEERTAQLTESEERFRVVAGISSDAIWDWDLVHNTIWWSDSFYKLFNYSPDEVSSGSGFWFSHIHPDDLQTVQHSMNDILSGAAKNWTARYRFRKGDGTYAYILNKSTVLQDENGTPYRILSSMMDVSAITEASNKLQNKNSELQSLMEEFRFVTDFMPQLVWSTTPEGFHDFYNKGWYDYTGLSYEQTKGEGWNNVLHKDDQERAFKVWRHSLATGAPYQIEYRFRRHDGEYRWFLGRALPLRDESGKILKWFGTCTDIHDQKIESDQLEEKVAERTQELQATNKELAERNNELLQFTSVTSHDLKEPLRKIQVFGHILRDQLATEPKNSSEGYVDKIVKAANRMSKLIDDLLDYSKIDFENRFELVNLNDLVGEVIDDLELAIQEKKATVEVGPLRSIECIPSQFQRVFQNLISNSLKFARKDVAPVISIEAEKVDGDASANGHNALRIVYKDNGIGFEKQYAKKIFEIFQRLHSKDQYEGTGIGLAIVKKIIDKHNGDIVADATSDEGATFVITVPLEQSKHVNPMVLTH